jgi:hypothetical protein
MRWQEIMEAGEAGYLYHWLDMQKGEHIFEFDEMPARFKHMIGGRIVLGNSFSRNKMFRFGYDRFVRLTVDKRMLGAQNKMIPLDAELVHRRIGWGKDGDTQDRHAHARTGAQFAEEFVVGDIRDLHRVITHIDIHGYNSGGFHAYVQFVKQYCHRHDISYTISAEAQKKLKRIEDTWAEDDELDESASDDPVYLRIGDWDRTTDTPRSRNYALGETEAGLSVYDLDADGQPIVPAEGEWAEHDLRDRLRSNDPKYLVRGRLVGQGHDGEPLLSHVQVVGPWNQ